MPARRRPALALALGLSAGSAAACDVALVLAIDVSGSIDAAEYRLQSGGLARALADPAIVELMVEARAALAVMQFSGAGTAELSLPWTRVTDAAAAARLAAAADAMPRAFRGGDTAPGDAIRFAAALFDTAPDCTRRVIDISGDGPQNAGSSTAAARQAAQRAGIAINGLAIEDPGSGLSVTGFYLRHVVTAGGFVMTSRGLAAYPAVLRAKLLRELARPVG